MKKAYFVVIDGADGAGKDTQAKRLVDVANKRGIKAALFAYPDYNTPVGRDIVAYQSGEFGELASAHPKLVSYLYAVNRFETQPALNAALATNDLVVAARYASSNLVYSSARVPKKAQRDFQAWLERLDYEVMGNPHEDTVIFLDVPIAMSDKLIAERSLGRRDINDENRAYRMAVHKQYLKLGAERSSWSVIVCSQEGKLRSIEDIGQQIEKLILPRLENK